MKKIIFGIIIILCWMGSILYFTMKESNNKIIKWVKRHMNKRFRQKEKEKIKKELYENN